MSIIYDALQKTQKQLNSKKEPTPYHRDWLDMGLWAIIVILLIVILFAYFPVVKYFLTNKTTKIKPVPVSAKPLHVSKLVVNGIFVSDRERLALINNRIVKAGEYIEGNKVLEISTNKVKLENNGVVFVLESGT